MSKTKIFSFSLPLLFILGSMATAGAGTIYVPDEYSSIQEAVDAASPGDTVVIRDGIYTENVNINKDHLTLSSEHGAERTVVEAANAADETFQVTADYVTVQGFTIRLGSTGMFLNGADYCNVFGNITLSNSRCGIHLFRSSHNNLTENTASSNSRDGICLEYSSNKNTLKRNTVSGNPEYGVYLKYSSHNRIYFNSFTGHSQSISSIDSTNTWTSSMKVAYTYHGSTYANYLGNYWVDYTGEDADNDGIGDGPYTINSDQDDYPLIEAFENYILFISISELK